MMSAAVMEPAGLLAEYRLMATRSRAERLMPMIEQMMRDIQLAPSELEAVALSLGPGSFTGLRVGVSTAKGLSVALGVSVIGLSSLEVLAASHAAAGCPYFICPILDAKRGEVYAALFQKNGEAGVKRLLADAVMKPDDLCDVLGKQNDPVLTVGTGAQAYAELFRQRVGAGIVYSPDMDHYPSAASAARIGLRRLLAGETAGCDPVPVYLSRVKTVSGPGGRGGL